MLKHSPKLRKKAKAGNLNNALFEMLANAPAAAIDVVNSFTRMKMREEGFFRRIMPSMAIPDDVLPVFDGPTTITKPSAQSSPASSANGPIASSAPIENEGGHAMTLLGVEGEDFVIQNSWGPSHAPGLMVIGPYELETTGW